MEAGKPFEKVTEFFQIPHDKGSDVAAKAATKTRILEGVFTAGAAAAAVGFMGAYLGLLLLCPAIGVPFLLLLLAGLTALCIAMPDEGGNQNKNEVVALSDKVHSYVNSRIGENEKISDKLEIATVKSYLNQIKEEFAKNTKLMPAYARILKCDRAIEEIELGRKKDEVKKLRNEIREIKLGKLSETHRSEANKLRNEIKTLESKLGNIETPLNERSAAENDILLVEIKLRNLESYADLGDSERNSIRGEEEKIVGIKKDVETTIQSKNLISDNGKIKERIYEWHPEIALNLQMERLQRMQISDKTSTREVVYEILMLRTLLDKYATAITSENRAKIIGNCNAVLKQILKEGWIQAFMEKEAPMRWDLISNDLKKTARSTIMKFLEPNQSDQ
jgi:hypothetical protein